MIDCPRYNSRLADSIAQEGGIDTIILTHKDDVCDHQKWKARFPNLQRIIHKLDVNKETVECEVHLSGDEVWNPDKDIVIIHTPGHTAGSLCIMVKTRFESEDGKEGQQLAIFQFFACFVH